MSRAARAPTLLALIAALAAAEGCSVHRTGICTGARWSIKTATDPAAAKIALNPVPTTIEELVELDPPRRLPKKERIEPTEMTVYRLDGVRLVNIERKTDGDYHLVLSDGERTMIAEVPSPKCSQESDFFDLIAAARLELDRKLAPSARPTPANLEVAIAGIGFFDIKHFQRGVARNAIELHPVLGICFEPGCDPLHPERAGRWFD